MSKYNAVNPLGKAVASADAGYAAVVGQRGVFNDIDTIGGVVTTNSQDSRQVILVQNVSGGTLSPCQALNFVTFGKTVQVAAYGQTVHGFVGPVVNGSATGTVANNAYFWMVYYGPTSFLGDGSTIAAGDPVAVGSVSGSVRKSVTTPLISSLVAASAAVTATTTPTTYSSFTIPANTLNIGDIIKVRAEGIVTAQNGTDTLTNILQLDSTTISTTGAIDPGTSDTFIFDAELVVRTIGASGTLVGTGFWTMGAPGTATAKQFILASTSIDTTASHTIGVQATWSTNNAGNSARLDILDGFKNVTANTTRGSVGGTAMAAVSTAVTFRGFANCQW